MTYAEYLHSQGRHARATAGVLEVLAHKAELYFTDSNDVKTHRHILSPPVILEKANERCSKSCIGKGVGQ